LGERRRGIVCWLGLRKAWIVSGMLSNWEGSIWSVEGMVAVWWLSLSPFALVRLGKWEMLAG
jgi:hypothetical protein